MPLTLEQAAQETGKSKRAISQAIKADKLPATKGKRGQWQIDPAALFQVFPKATPSEPAPPPQAPWPPQVGDSQKIRIEQLEQTVQQFRQELAQTVSPIRQKLEEVQKQIRSLEHQLAQETEERQQLAESLAEQKAGEKRGFWPRWFYRGG